jgi:hypothetical protein
MPEVEVFIGVTITNDDGTKEQHGLSGVSKHSKDPVPTIVAATGMKVLKKVLSEVRAGS